MNKIMHMHMKFLNGQRMGIGRSVVKGRILKSAKNRRIVGCPYHNAHGEVDRLLVRPLLLPSSNDLLSVIDGGILNQFV